MQQNEWDALVIGGGVAGLSAAQMLGRARRRTLVIDAGEPRNRFAAHMHGVLGQDGRSPADLLADGRRELARYDVEVRVGAVASLTDDGARVRARLTDGAEVAARAIVLATGIVDELPDVPGLAELWGDRVLHCPYCHGFEVADGHLGVLLASPASAHQATLVRQWSEHVTVFTAAGGDLDADALEQWRARGQQIVPSAVTAVEPTDAGIRVHTADGGAHELTALFTGGDPRLPDGLIDALGLDRADAPGRPVVVDMLGATSNPRVWAAGNIVAPFGNVPISMGSGAMAGAGVNAALVQLDTASAVRRARAAAEWEARYASEDRVWSGRVNATLVDLVAGLPTGTALDVGAGEGGDAIWLGAHGWRVRALDVSPTAAARAQDAARAQGLDDAQVSFVAGDALTDLPTGAFDLVTSSFLHSWEDDFPRIEILRQAAERVAPGGHLVVVSHAAAPPWTPIDHEHRPHLRTPAEELPLLQLDEQAWETLACEVRNREVDRPDGSSAVLDDGVLVLRRRPV